MRGERRLSKRSPRELRKTGENEEDGAMKRKHSGLSVDRDLDPRNLVEFVDCTSADFGGSYQ